MQSRIVRAQMQKHTQSGQRAHKVAYNTAHQFTTGHTAMTLDQFLAQLRQSPEQCQFADLMQVIADNYHYSPSAFSNGTGGDALRSDAGSNEGSCKIFAFAQLHQLTPEQTLACFGDYYRLDVLQHPDADDHGNIRRFMRDGWAGIKFDSASLTAK